MPSTDVYRPILATLGYVLSPEYDRVLLVERNARAEDDHFGKYNGLGGKIRDDEDVVQGMQREIFEESGLTCEKLELAGTISWPGFGSGGEDWFAFIFRITVFSGQPVTRNEEGCLHWVPLAKVSELPLWEGDRYFLPLVFGDDPTRFKSPAPATFHGVMPYQEGRPVSWTYSVVPAAEVSTY